jgi:hypothetical protein
MPDIEIVINDAQLKDLLATLDKMDMAHLGKPVFEAIGRDIMDVTSVYPPAPPESTYRRTGNLGNRWYTRASESMVVIGNAAEYAGYVHGPDQTLQHEDTGWKRLLETAEQSIPALIRMIEAQIDRIWKGRQG